MASIRIIAAALVIVGGPAFADTQVIASPGVTLTESAQAKFNRDTRQDDRYIKPVAGSSGPSRQFYAAAGLSMEEGRGMSLEQILVLKNNREVGRDNAQYVAVPSSGISRAYGAPADYSGLAASAGLSADEAAGMTLSEIAAAKFARDTGDD